MSLLGSNMAEGVRSELCRRSKIIPDGYGPWSNARIPWVRFTPCVSTGGSSGERKRVNSIIFGGNLNKLSNSYRLNKSTRLGPYSPNYMDIRDGLSGGSKRNNPKPGIRSLKVEEKGTLGGIKKLTVELTIWSKEELSRLQHYLFALGKHAIVEWGWNIDTAGRMVDSNMGKGKDSNGKLFAEMPDSQFTCEVRSKQSQHRFCYDAVRGIISNFNWSINESAGFDCTIELTSKGTTFLSTPTETATMHSGCNEDPDDNQSEIDKVHRPNMEQPLFFLRQNLRTTHENKEPYKNPDGGSPIGMAALFDKELGAMDYIGSIFQDLIGGGPTNEELDFYITWDYFEEYIVNRKLAPLYAKGNSAGNKDTSTSQPGKELCDSGGASDNPQMFIKAYNEAKPHMFEQPRTANKVYNLDSRGTELLNSSFLLSADPGKIMLPYQEHWKLHPSSISAVGAFGAWAKGIIAYGVEYAKSRIKLEGHSQAKKNAERAQEDAKEEALDEAAREANVDAATSSTLQKFKPFDHKYKSISGNNGPGSSGRGLLSNILINVAFIEDTCNEAKSLDEFMDIILQGTQESCGDIWDLQLVEDPDNPQVVRVIDKNMVRHAPEVKGFHFQGIGRKSIARELNLETDIDSKMAAMMMYGSNKNEATSGEKMGQPMGGAPSNEFRLFNHELKDLVMDGIALPDSTDQSIGSDCCGTGVATDKNVVQDAWAGYYKSAEELSDQVDEDSSEGMVTAMRKLISLADPEQGLPTAEDAQITALVNGDTIISIPLKLSMVLDGISGLRWGNFVGFTRDTAIPKQYTSEPIGGKSFQIVGIDHQVDAGDWKITLRCIMRPLPCDGSGISNCSSNQGNLPSSIMPTTETIKFDLIPLTPPVTNNRMENENKEQDELELVRIEPIKPKLIDQETNFELEGTTTCPCEDGSRHEDCCKDPVTPDTPVVVGVLPVVKVDEDEIDDEKACQCPDGEFRKDCCEDGASKEGGDDGTTGNAGGGPDPAACEDPEPQEEPGEVILNEEKTKESDDVEIEVKDHVVEEDCTGWGKRGEVIASGTVRFSNSILFQDSFYYEYRRHQEHCFFIDLYIWHGRDGSDNGKTSRRTFSSMVPPGQGKLQNLFGTPNIFSAAVVNRRASAEHGAGVMRARRTYGSDTPSDIAKKLKEVPFGSRKPKRGSNYQFLAGYNVNVNLMNDYGSPDGLRKGSRFSSGIWVAEQTNWFRDDQPFEVNQPTVAGEGGPDEYDLWTRKVANSERYRGRRGKGLAWVIPHDAQKNQSDYALCKRHMELLSENHSGILWAQARINHRTWVNGPVFDTPYRHSTMWLTNQDKVGNKETATFSQKMLDEANFKARSFGFHPAITYEVFKDVTDVYEGKDGRERLQVNNINGAADKLYELVGRGGGRKIHSLVIEDDFGNRNEHHPFETRF